MFVHIVLIALFLKTVYQFKYDLWHKEREILSFLVYEIAYLSMIQLNSVSAFLLQISQQ